MWVTPHSCPDQSESTAPPVPAVVEGLPWEDVNSQALPGLLCEQGPGRVWQPRASFEGSTPGEDVPRKEKGSGVRKEEERGGSFLSAPGKKTDAQRKQVTLSRSHSYCVAEPGLGPIPLAPSPVSFPLNQMFLPPQTVGKKDIKVRDRGEERD